MAERHRLTVELDDERAEKVEDARTTEFGKVPKAEIIRNALDHYLDPSSG